MWTRLSLFAKTQLEAVTEILKVGNTPQATPWQKQAYRWLKRREET
ncbi:hypothetical protein CKA32_006429 [Geitlerinema sp. FC II]|nr:hypothetical protein CKA32_006429 [Geitlerinema sp. FC II]